jgi:hypothetical protein
LILVDERQPRDIRPARRMPFAREIVGRQNRPTPTRFDASRLAHGRRTEL